MDRLGEAVILDDHLVVAPCRGRFKAGLSHDAASTGEYVVPGQIVGLLATPDGHIVEVTTPFSGWLMRFLAPEGKPVRPGEALVWIRRA